MKSSLIVLALSALLTTAWAAEPAKTPAAPPAKVTKEDCVKKSKDGKKCLEKKQVPQPTRNPVAEKKKQEAEKAAKKKPVK